MSVIPLKAAFISAVCTSALCQKRISGRGSRRRTGASELKRSGPSGPCIQMHGVHGNAAIRRTVRSSTDRRLILACSQGRNRSPKSRRKLSELVSGLATTRRRHVSANSVFILSRGKAWRIAVISADGIQLEAKPAVVEADPPWCPGRLRPPCAARSRVSS